MENKIMLDKVIEKLSPLAKENVEAENRVVYFNGANNTALAGLRRSYNEGAAFLRIKTEEPLVPNLRGENFIFLTKEKEIVETDVPGLLGRRLHLSVDSDREIVTTDIADANINNHYEKHSNGFNLWINPKEWLKYISNELKFSNTLEKAISIMPMALTNANGNMIAKLIFNPAGDQLEVMTPRGAVYFSVNDTYVNVNENDNGNNFLIEVIGEVNGEKVARIVARYNPGIHMTIREFPSGQVPYDGAKYSVIPGQYDNGVTNASVQKFEFIDGQDKITMNRAPLINFPLDTFYQVLLAFSDFSVINIKYTDAVQPAVIHPISSEGGYRIEALISPLVPYISGRQLTL